MEEEDIALISMEKVEAFLESDHGNSRRSSPLPSKSYGSQKVIGININTCHRFTGKLFQGFFIRHALAQMQHASKISSALLSVSLTEAEKKGYALIKSRGSPEIWYYNAAFESESALNLRHHTDIPLTALADCYDEMGIPDTG